MEAICGFDPGLARTGYAIIRVVDGVTSIIDAGVCRLPTREPLAARLAALAADVESILDEHQPIAVAVEEVYSHYQHPRTAVLMGHARGVILLACAQAHVAIHSFSATRIKKQLTGNGRASKSQMQHAIRDLLGLGRLPEPHDVADAVAAAICCGQTISGRAWRAMRAGLHGVRA